MCNTWWLIDFTSVGAYNRLDIKWLKSWLSFRSVLTEKEKTHTLNNSLYLQHNLSSVIVRGLRKIVVQILGVNSLLHFARQIRNQQLPRAYLLVEISVFLLNLIFQWRNVACVELMYRTGKVQQQNQSIDHGSCKQVHYLSLTASFLFFDKDNYRSWIKIKQFPSKGIAA